MTEDWQPLSVREGAQPADPGLHEGVPDWLDKPLRAWLAHLLDGEPELATLTGLKLRLSARDVSMTTALVYRSDAEQLLNAIDYVLARHPALLRLRQAPQHISPGTKDGDLVAHLVRLCTVLQEGGSAWTAIDAFTGLERRVDASASAAASAAGKAATSSGRPEAARDLAEAWAAVYGRHPNWSEGYRLAIRAVEDVAIPLTLPESRHATLGTVNAHLRDAPDRWRLSIGSDGAALGSMVNLLWTGQSDRHAGQMTLDRVEQPAAEAAVHLAAVLVQWFAGGHVQRVPVR